LFKDQNEHEDKSESDDGEQDFPPANTTRIGSKKKKQGKNLSGKSQPKKKKGEKCQDSKVI
jgi:hypothetical protein